MKKKHLFDWVVITFVNMRSIKSKAGAIKCCKEVKITAPPNEWHNIPFSEIRQIWDS